MTMFADDIGIALKYDKISWQEMLKELRDFQRLTGLKVNYDKTVVYRLDSIRRTNAKMYSKEKLQWTNEPIYMHGLWLTHEKETLYKKNYDPLVKKVASLLQLWEQRRLLLMGKVMIFNTLIVSLFMYKFTVLQDIPRRIVMSLEEMGKTFLWKGRAKIPMNIVQGLKTDGSLGLVNLIKKDEAMKLQWIERIKENKILHAFAQKMLDNSLGNAIWEIQLDKNDFGRIFHWDNFWVNVLRIKIDYDTFNREGDDSIRLDSIIWYNSQIRIGNTPVLYKTWVNKGIIRVKDLMKKEKFLNYKEFCNKYNFSPQYLKYCGLIDAILKKWNV